ncbi:hypothetical protein BH09BAC3_BH09BAC3_19050 [soil metagenome]
MEFIKLQNRSEFDRDMKSKDRFEGFQQLITELEKKGIPAEMVNSINTDIELVNSIAGSGSEILKQLKKSQIRILKMLEKELKLVTINHYRNMWLAVGISAFGIPFGVAIGISLGNLGLLGIGFPIGMGIGWAVGSSMDKKAKESGRQLDVELK